MIIPRRLLSGISALILIIIAGSVQICAETATPDEMRNVCRNWLDYMVLQTGNWNGVDTPQIAFEREMVTNDTVVGRYFEIDPSGFVVVPILKDMPPVKAYSDEFRLDFDDPEGMPALLRDVLEHRVRQFVNIYGSLEAVQPDKSDQRMLGSEHRDQWNLFELDEKAFNAELAQKSIGAFEEFGPLLTTSWHQNFPYNNYCPYGDGGRTVVGCVATASAQIMAYHQWPPEGTSSRNYWWPGDNSCGGSTSGAVLSADFSDSYDWENIRNNCNGGCDDDEQAALAELCYEVGVAFTMDYGRCGSGAYTADAQVVLPFYFRYHDWIEKHDRSDYPLQVWSDYIRLESEAGRPFQYRIQSHSIVGDGWRQVDDLYQLHLNYGWGGSNNAWYTIDDLYCPWDGCSPSVEYMLTNIVPDRGVLLAADTTWGQVPLEVQFTGSSSLDVTSWIWAFGDGDSSFVQSPGHTYQQAGRYDVTLTVIAGEETRSYETTNYISVLADTLIGSTVMGDPGSDVEVIISGSNTVPLRTIKIPVEYPGDLALSLDSFSTDGCRVDYFDHKTQLQYDPYNRRGAFSMYNTESTTADLEPGSGPLVKLYFSISPSANATQTASIVLDGYATHLPTFDGPIITYAPIDIAGMITLTYDCGDANGDGLVNLLDILSLVDFLYQDGAAPAPLAAGDADGDGDCNLLDVLYMIDFLYGTPRGPAPLCP